MRHVTGSISWLHLSDLHIGHKEHIGRLPNLREIFFNDLRQLHELSGPWHLVLFSGDIVNTGAKQEFDAATEFLAEMWKVMKSLGSTPRLVASPGNHDIHRPRTKNNPSLKALRSWHADHALRQEFWTSSSSAYRRLVERAFASYCEWYDNLPLPKLSDVSRGLLPGDMAVRGTVDGLRVGVVCLNSSFLQLTGDDYQGRLELDVRQLANVCQKDHTRWLEEVDLAFLLTHHSPAWLEPDRRREFDADVYPPGRFYSHICGHLHEPEATDQSVGGAEVRRTRIGASLFGLERSANTVGRRHGYSAGQITLTPSGELLESMWPRLALPGQAGNVRFAPDHQYELDKNQAVTWSSQRLVPPPSGSDAAPSQSDRVEGEFSLLADVSEAAAKTALQVVPRTRLEYGPQHRKIRRQEQLTAEQLLHEKRHVWVISDWGLATREFVASFVAAFGEHNDLRSNDVFSVQCDEVISTHALRESIHKQLGVTVQQLFSRAAGLPFCLLVLENLSLELTGDAPVAADNDIRSVLQSFLDYCPSLHIVLTARCSPQWDVPVVELRALELPDVRTYVQHHPTGGDSLIDVETIEILHRRSAGLPVHLDRLLDSLRYVGREELGEFELDTPSDAHEEVPHSLERAVAELANSPARYSKRSYRLLKILTLLPDGERLEQLKYFDRTEPLFPRNAAELEDLSLLQVVQDTDLLLARSTSSQAVPGSTKRLLVPRQVRDCVRRLMSDAEQREMYERAAEIVFGADWRNGNLRSRYFAESAVGRRNESVIFKRLLADAIEMADQTRAQRITQLIAGVVDGLNGKDRYREASVIIKELLPLVRRVDDKASESTILKVHGSSLRMLGHADDAATVLEQLLNDGEMELEKQELLSVQADLAFIYERRKNKTYAVRAAQEMQRLSPKKSSGKYLEAEAIIANMTLEDAERVNKLKSVERRAREQERTRVANNTALTLSGLEEAGPAESWQQRVIDSKGDQYNRLRAIVAKANRLIALGRSSSLSPEEHRILAMGYSYLYTQRMTSLFRSCHGALWKILVSERRLGDLLRIFRHSSFLWRLYGEVDTERQCYNELERMELDDVTRSGGIDAVYFEARRLELRA